MSVETNKAIVRHTHEAVSRHDLDAAGQYQSPAYAERWQADKRGLQALFAAFPDGRWELEDLVAEGDKVAVRDTFHGTHQGAFMGLPPTGRRVTIGGMHLFALAEGQIVDHWNQRDQLGLMQQLGVVPTPEAGAW